MPWSLRRLVLLLTLGLALGWLAPVAADPAPPRTDPRVRIVDLGIYCRPQIAGQEAAPDTSLGYINLFSEQPVIRYRQQQVPAALGLSFGLIIVSQDDVPQARMESWKPGRTEPEVWFADIVAGEERARGFTFDFDSELIPGIWRLEAWDGDRQLYSVEFEVLSPSALPGIQADCGLMS